MKHTIKLLTVLCITFMIFSCKDEEEEIQKGITYPDSIYHGQSLLTLPDSAIVVFGKEYGFAANLEKDATLIIKMTDLSEVDTNGYTGKWYYAMPPTGWLASTWDDGKQTFTATQTGKIDLRMQFLSFDSLKTSGICKLEFYENGATVTKTKYLRWE